MYMLAQDVCEEDTEEALPTVLTAQAEHSSDEAWKAFLRSFYCNDEHMRSIGA
jgi:hypothetical protein